MSDIILNNLNEQQLNAVTETEGYIRVIAGAGSGKTRALTSRFAYIVDQLGVNSSNILCVTFTNKAAQEMRKRVKKILNHQVDLSLITTYHGFCVQVLREEINKIQYPNRFVIMDIEDQKTILREVFSELAFDSKVFTFKQVIRAISRIKSEQKYLNFILEDDVFEPKSDLEKIFYRYLNKQKRNFALDFDDLLNFTLYIFEKHKDVLNKWQNRIHYIQVDETQDTSEKQFYLIELLSEINKNLFVVGDPDQTIYEWRGARPEILVDFDKKFEETKTIFMNQNYRSTPNILELGNTIIRNNKIRLEKDMYTSNVSGIDVQYFHAKSDFEEGEWIANEIKRLIFEFGIDYSDVAILYRANYLSRIIEQSLIKENIPYLVFGGVKFFERKEIKDLLSYLRLLCYNDDFSFLRVINTPSRGLGKKFTENLIKIAERDNLSLFDALVKNLNSIELKRDGSIEFVRIINELLPKINKIKVSDLIKEILDITGLTRLYRTDGDSERLENIRELQNSLIHLESIDDLSLENYLQEISLYTDLEDNDDSQKVKLMTIHTSKGLEFPYVFICGLTEGVIPSAISLKERRKRALEEERRLVYVAITRAEKALFLSDSEGYNFNTGMNKIPSRFLLEIYDTLKIKKGELNDELINQTINYVKKSNNEFENYDFNQINKPEFSINELVDHKIFGIGRIIEINIDKEIYTIFFEDKKFKREINFDFKGITKIV
jgi:DNA helicase-2/ATP-dependent DNA helicase PcrA